MTLWLPIGLACGVAAAAGVIIGLLINGRTFGRCGDCGRRRWRSWQGPIWYGARLCGRDLDRRLGRA